jgi:hypothetical protein
LSARTFCAVLRQAVREYIEFDYVSALQAYRATEATLRHLEDHLQAAGDFVGANFIREAIAKAKTALPLPRSEPAKGAGSSLRCCAIRARNWYRTGDRHAR